MDYLQITYNSSALVLYRSYLDTYSTPEQVINGALNKHEE